MCDFYLDLIEANLAYAVLENEFNV
jgi:hypothetical protein